MNKADVKSQKIFHANIRWLLNSDIRIKNGKNRGALYGWKNLNPVSFPFIYSEITGYAITAFSWIYSFSDDSTALAAAKESSEWIIRNMRSHLLFARPSADNNSSNNLSNMFYAFDNGMIMIGLLNLYKITKDVSLLSRAELMAKEIIKRFFDGSKLIPRLDNHYNLIADDNKHNENVKWSSSSGAYHCKLSIGLLELSKLTKDIQYAKVSNSLCNYAKKLQKPNGRFIMNANSDITYLHPHLYACEGLIHSGIVQSNENHYSAGLKGIRWALEQLDSSRGGGLARDTRKESLEQSDCTAQLLRLLIICSSQLQKSYNVSCLQETIDKLHSRLLDFCITSGEDHGGMRYHPNLDSACSWCTMFSMQALGLWKLRNTRNTTWIDFFI